MTLSHKPGNIVFFGKDLRVSFFPTGDIDRIVSGNILINGFAGTMKEGSANNLWLRVYKDEGLRFFPLLGVSSGSAIEYSDAGLRFQGDAEGIAYCVNFSLAENAWFWSIELSGCGELVDIVYGQDAGVAEMDSVLANELYVSQYLGHSVFQGMHGYCVCSRQNHPQSGRFPYLQQGMLQGTAAAYGTDALQFFGLTYKSTHVPASLEHGLPSQNIQLESAYIGLQSENIRLDEPKRVTFYGCYLPDHPGIVERPAFTEEYLFALANTERRGGVMALTPVRVKPEFGDPYTSPQWDESHIFRFFPRRTLEERQGEELLSFFTPEHTHVVLQQKELLVERPHGNIVTTKINTSRVDCAILAATHSIAGVFNAQIAVGNTSKHKLLSAPRGLFNIRKNTGQRLWMRQQGRYRLLALPAAFEMGFHYSRWFYALDCDTLIITAFSAADETRMTLDVESENGRKYDFILTNQLVMGEHEFRASVCMEQEDDTLVFRQDPSLRHNSPYPRLRYDMRILNAAYTVSDDRIFFEDGQSQNGTLLTISLAQTEKFRVEMSGALDGEERRRSELSFEAEKDKYRCFYAQILRGFLLVGGRSDSVEIAQLNATAYWFAHNALIHYAAPHGLEQPGGAAWGTRDICQGPMELFLSTQNYPLARSVLLHIFAHQSKLTGEWPQWFMFDRYSDEHHACHGDIVFWPLKCIGDYLRACGDTTILYEKVPYAHDADELETNLLDHIKTAVDTVKTRFLAGTSLISYAGGDWDDTLQPVSESLKTNLVSSWTQALAYQVFSQLGCVLREVDAPYSAHLGELAERVGDDFKRYLIVDGVIAGFVFRESYGSFSPLLHPGDNTTGIHYRLLPLTRSIIAGLVNKEQARKNKELIDRHLSFPDGVRLMDRPAPYQGGVSRTFLRAEQAANVGREIGLQYVHAHIRYLEALCHMRAAKDAWAALFQISPVGIREHVKNACIRQANMYFSSSDGAFKDRHEYAENFAKLRSGEINVKGGWRLYSSGPGIYVSQLVSGILGICFSGDTLIVAPVLPKTMDGLQFHFTCFDIPFVFTYHRECEQYTHIHVTDADGCSLSRPGAESPSQCAGAIIDKETLLSCSGDLHVWTY